MDTISADGKRLTINTGVADDNYTQLKSEISYTKVGAKGEHLVDKYDLCNCHAMWRCLESVGWKPPYGKKSRPPDRLAEFIFESRDVAKFYKGYAKALYDAWEAGDPDAYSPMEVHEVLAHAVNMWLGYPVVRFVYKASVHRQIIPEVVLENRPLVVSGKFAGLGHVVSLVGFVYDVSDPRTLVSNEEPLGRLFESQTFWSDDPYERLLKVKVVRSAVEETMRTGVVKVFPSSVVIDDPYGACCFTSTGKKRYDGGSGNDNVGTYQDFVTDLKELGNADYKMAHFFSKNGAGVSC